MSQGILFVLESFRRHMDNGRWLFQLGMEAAGYRSAGGELPKPGIDCLDVQKVVEKYEPRIVVFWPRYEWHTGEWVGPEVTKAHQFVNWEYLLKRPDILRVTVFHDAGSARDQQRRWHKDFNPHVYLTWYHDQSVLPFAPWVDGKTVRTYHVVDADHCGSVEDRGGYCAVSGAYVPDVYPLRMRVAQAAMRQALGDTEYLTHPGYAQAGTHSDSYVRRLSCYRVAICTCSAYKFALRKIFEATAAGCRVITNLPEYDRLPEIDGNLIRVPDDVSLAELRAIIDAAYDHWDLDTQRCFADRCVRRYDWRVETARIAGLLEERYADLLR